MIASSETMAPPPLVPVLAVVGVGLIGGSLALALKRSGAVGKVLGVGRQLKSLRRAQELGLIDEVATLEQAAQQADLIVLATPIGAMASVLKTLRPHLRDDTLISDAGSTKVDVVSVAREALGDRISQFVPGHPIAGAETVGPEAARADLYDGRNVILTPWMKTVPAHASV